MKATPARLPQGQGALVVPDPQTGRELLLTETGFKTLKASLGHEVEASRIAAGSLFLGSLVMGLGALPGLAAAGFAALLPLAALAGSLWGRAGFQRKLRRLAEGHIPRHAVLGGGSREFLVGALVLAALVMPPMNPLLGVCLFLVTAASAAYGYGGRSRKLAEEVTRAFEDPALVESASLLEDPGDLLLLGQGREGSGNCPVCGEGLGSPGAAVHCDDCGTGHHPECWTYAGRCSVYGCPGTSVRTDQIHRLF